MPLTRQRKSQHKYELSKTYVLQLTRYLWCEETTEAFRVIEPGPCC